MAIRKLSTSSIGYGTKSSRLWDQSTFANNFESIATVLTTATTSSINFSSIPSTYAHLQIRITSAQDSAANIHVQLNGDTGSNYYWHEFFGDGTTPQAAWSSGAVSYIKTGYTHNTGTYYSGSSIVTILDYTNAAKKTVSAFTGSNQDATGSGYVLNRSGHWTGTSAVSSLTFVCGAGNFKTNTRIAVYGIRG